jgi:hypothetical protein
MKNPTVDYFNMPPMRGSSPTASLAADMSSNLHMDQRYQTPLLARSPMGLTCVVAVPSWQRRVGRSSRPTSSSRWTIGVSLRTFPLAEVLVLMASSSSRNNNPASALGRSHDTANSLVLAVRPRRLDGHLASAAQSPLQLHLRAHRALAEPCHHPSVRRRRHDLAMRGAAAPAVPCTHPISDPGSAARVCCRVSIRLHCCYGFQANSHQTQEIHLQPAISSSHQEQLDQHRILQDARSPCLPAVSIRFGS